MSKVEEDTVQEEDIRNRLVFQKLYGLVKKYGFTIAPDRLKGFTLPVTEFGRSRNDHCFIHYDSFYKRDKVNIGVILSPSTRAVSSYDIETGSTAAGIIEFTLNFQLTRP